MAVHEKYRALMRDQRQFFDELITEDWHTYRSDDWDYVRQYEVRELFRQIQPAKILDVGCGCGFHDQEMAGYSFVNSVMAIDYSEKSVLVAEREYPHEKVRRQAVNYSDFPRDDKFDLVVSFQVIEHLEDASEFLEFCASVCRPNGHVAVFTPNRLRFSNRLLKLKGQPEQLCDSQHFREFSKKDLLEIALRSGLKASGSFGYTLSGTGVKWVDGGSVERRTQLGKWFPSIANGIALLFSNREN